MRKACIELSQPERMAFLVSGELGYGKCLHAVQLLPPDAMTPEQERWRKAVAQCQKKATELKYEVNLIRGKSLAGL